MADYGPSQYSPPCHWVLCRGDSIPNNAVSGGKDVGGATLFVGRVAHGGDMLPGKVSRSQGACYVSFEDREHKYKEYQVLVSNGASLSWLPASVGQVPSGAIQGGVTGLGEPLYIGRARHGSTLTIGKIHPSLKCLYVPYDGKEHKYAEYEVLVCDALNF